jgi:GT2 family glycosyltransferase
MTKLSIVIVTWNVKKYAAECLTSLAQATEGLSSEIIVIDNASADGTTELIRAQFPHVKLIESGANLGFARANNVGIKLATGNYVCLINPDVNVPADCLHKMFQFMEQRPTIGLLGPKMLGSNGAVCRSGMRFPTIWNGLLRALALDSLFKGTGIFGGWLMSDFQFDRTRDIDVLNGWFWMARKEALEQVGLLDERFFMYGEDLDWSKRFHRAGWRVVFYADAEAVHYGGASSSNSPVRFYIEMQRANLQYWKKHHGRISFFFFWLTVGLNHATRTLGYGVVYLAKRSLRCEALFKMKRSYACIRWLMNFRSVGEPITK